MTQREQLLANSISDLTKTIELFKGILERNLNPHGIIPNDNKLLGDAGILVGRAVKNWDEFNRRDKLKVEAMELALNVN